MKRGVIPQLFIGFITLFFLLGFIVVITSVIQGLSFDPNNQSANIVGQATPFFLAVIVIGGVLYSIQRGLQ